MDRRIFLLSASAWTLKVLARPPSGGWREGVHYLAIPAAGSLTKSLRKALVTEVFSYGCIHCYHLQSLLDTWTKQRANRIDFLRLPVQWSEKQRAYAKLYYTLEALNRRDLHSAVFEEIHVRNEPLIAPDPATTFTLQARFAAQHAVPTSDFERCFSSPTVTQSLRSDQLFLESIPVNGTPTMVVDKRFVTDPSRCPGASTQTDENNLINLLEITDYLVSLEIR